MNTYTHDVTRLLEQHKNEIHEQLASGMTLDKVKAYAMENILPLPTDETKKNYLMRLHQEDMPLIRMHVEKMLTIEFLEQRAALFDRVAERIQTSYHPSPRDMATTLIREQAEDIDFFDTLSVYDYDTYDNWDNLHKWACEAVFESAWETVFGQLETERHMNGVADNE